MSLNIKENVPLAPFTTFKIGGPARYFTEVKNEEEAREALRLARERGLQVFILGGGSNILVSDEGFPGLVIHNQIRGFESRIEGSRAVIEVGAGEDWDETARRCVEANFAGIECMSGIPGSCGAAPVQNIGAYGQSVDAVIQEVHAVRCDTEERRVFQNAQCEFEYRNSIFKENPGKYFITRVVLSLISGGAPTLVYQDLKDFFADRGTAPSLAEVRQAVIEIRARKGYVILPGYESYRSAGSFFKNPVVPREDFKRIESAIGSSCPSPWFWEASPEAVKVSAACLIQSAGFSKGHRKGEVGISPKHPLSLVNYGSGSAGELARLAQEIQGKVAMSFGVTLEPEVEAVGFATLPF